MATDDLTDRDYWYREGGRCPLVEVTGHPFATVLDRFLPVDPALTCAEIGAYPGTNLCHLARRFGYRATAIEFRKDARDIAELFAFNGLPAPEVLEVDLRDTEGLRFDVVASFGFAEHFRDFDAIVARHAGLVAPGGLLVLSVPHFEGFQGWARRATMTEAALAELRASHNMEAMRLGAVRRALRSAGMDVLYARHAMNARFWIPPDSPKIRPEARMRATALSWFDRTVGRWLPSCGLYSPMILTVSRKPAHGTLEGR